MWNRFQGDEQTDGEIPEDKAVELPPQETKIDQAPQGLTIITKRQVLREFYITEKDAENHGYTRGVGKQPPTAECRERFRKLMSDDARVQLANQKRQRFAEEEQDRKRRKEEKREDKARKKKREEEEEETSRKRTCQSSRSSDGVVLGHGSKRKMEDDLGDDQVQMETEEIAEVDKGLDRHRDDFFAATPPLEAVRAVLSMAATKSSNGPVKKVMMIDAKKAHLNPRCKEDVYIELPPEVGADLGQCGKLNFWLYGFRKAASA